MARFKDMKMLTKILLMGFIIIILVAAPVFVLVLPKVKAQIKNDKQVQLVNLINTSHTMVNVVYSQYQQGLISEDAAKKESLKLLKGIRYEETNYFWVNDMHPTMIMHPIKPEMDGQDQTNYKDTNGKQIFVEFARICGQSGEGSVDYMWPKPGFAKPQPKLSYVKLFKPWGWGTGTGIYIDDINAILAKLQWYIIGIIAGSFLLAFLISFFTSKMMSDTINKVVNVLKDIAEGEGDLTKRIDVSSKDEVGMLAYWFNTFVEKVHDIISQVSTSTSQVASASQELSASSEEMASGAEEQTAQTTQVATSMEEMSATVQEVAKNASEAAGNAKNAGDTAKKGGDVVQQTIKGINEIAAYTKASVEAIQNLSRNSEQIGDIIKVIDDVADQTNLLALNAAIEAARAGEQGRGFAVVADEVRKLAERTSTSTKEIQVMVKTMQDGIVTVVNVMAESSKGVDKGVKLAEQAGTILNEIVKSAQHVVDLVQQVATAAEEQSAAAEEISSNIESVASVTKQSAQGVQQISSASQELSSLSDGLQSIVKKFKLREGTVKIEERKILRSQEIPSSAGMTKKPAQKKS